MPTTLHTAPLVRASDFDALAPDDRLFIPYLDCGRDKTRQRLAQAARRSRHNISVIHNAADRGFYAIRRA